MGADVCVCGLCVGVCAVIQEETNPSDANRYMNWNYFVETKFLETKSRPTISRICTLDAARRDDFLPDRCAKVFVLYYLMRFKEDFL